MADDFADGWIAFEEAVDRLRTTYSSLTKQDIQQYCKQYAENWED